MISSKIKKDEEEGGVAGEWKYAAMVMDRFDDDANADDHTDDHVDDHIDAIVMDRFDDNHSSYSYAYNFMKNLRCTVFC